MPFSQRVSVEAQRMGSGWSAFFTRTGAMAGLVTAVPLVVNAVRLDTPRPPPALPALTKGFLPVSTPVQRPTFEAAKMPAATSEQALANARAAFGTRHLQTMVAINSLATLYGREGRFSDAETLFREALWLGRTTFGPINAITVAAMSGLDDIRRAAGATDEDVAVAPRGQPRAEQNRAADVDAELDKLLRANVVFNVPERARVGTSRRIEAVLSLTEDVHSLLIKLREEGRREAVDLRVSSRMTAVLHGGHAFEITPSGPQTQFISRRESTYWRWEFLPKKAGTQVLTLIFEVHLSIDGKEGTRTVCPPVVRTIDVDVEWPGTWAEWLSFLKKTGEDLGWLWATLLVPLMLFLRRVWRRLRASAPSSTAPTSATKVENYG